MASPAPTIPLRFQRQELAHKAALTEAGRAALDYATGPQDLLATLMQAGLAQDAVSALAMMLPRRQAVWWGCLAVRLIPDLADRPAELLAVEISEAWVQSQRAEDCERAAAAAELCPFEAAAGLVALATAWSGPSLAPRGQAPVTPAPHLTGTAVRGAIIMTVHDRAIAGRVTIEDLFAIGTALMHGDVGRTAQGEVRQRLASAA
ncbi:MAG: hypothetical protein PGN09_05130 [Sphingomonas fennica]